MSRVETPTETFNKFALTPGWINSSEEILTNDLSSMSNESNLFLNPSYYEEKNGRLWDPIRNRLVAGSAINADETEEKVINQLETWFLSHESGIAVHISPKKEPNGKHPGYPEEQITIFRIGYKWPTLQKILFLTSHQFKANFKNPEDLRKFIFTEDDKEQSIFEILNWLKNVSQKRVETNLHDVEKRMVQARHYARQIISGVPIDVIARDMKQTGFLGDNPIGCGGVTQTSTSTYSENITQFFDYTQTESWHMGICRVCGASTLIGPCSICRTCEKKF